MASKTSRVPFLRALLKRNFSAQAKPVSCAASDIKVTTLPNKMVVVSADCSNQGLVKVSVAVKAGSRYENGDNQGVSHIIRASAGLSTVSASKFNIIRNLQQMGSSLTASSDRETIVYTLETTCNHLLDGLKYLRYITCEQCFKPWELSDNIPQIEVELATIPPLAILMDNLHAAAYRSGLGNPIFAKGYNLKSLGTETAQHFVNNTFLANRAAVAGVGIDHATLEDFAKELTLEGGSGENDVSRYHGGEIRHDANMGMTHVAVGAESVGLTKKEVFAFAVLRCALGGSGSPVKWGIGSSPLAKAVEGINSGPIAAQAFHAAHSDSGLFGVVISAKPNLIKEAVESSMKALKGGITDDDIMRGKKQLISEVLFSSEKSGSLAEDMSIQGVTIGGARSPKQLADAVEQVSTAQVQEAYKKIVSGTKSMASIGAIKSVPYLNEL